MKNAKGGSAAFLLHFSFYLKKNADDGNRRPVLTSETTKRKTLENVSSITYLEKKQLVLVTGNRSINNLIVKNNFGRVTVRASAGGTLHNHQSSRPGGVEIGKRFGNWMVGERRLEQCTKNDQSFSA